MTRRVWWSLYEIQGRDWIRRALSVSSSPFIRPSRKGWEWDWRSAARSCRPMAAGSGLRRIAIAALRFISVCQPARNWHDIRSRSTFKVQGSTSASPSSKLGTWNLEQKASEGVTESEAIVYVIDDDAQTRESLKNLMRSVGLHVE